MTHALKLVDGILECYPKEMYPNDPHRIQRDNQMFTFRKTEYGSIQVFVESIDSDTKRSKL